MAYVIGTITVGALGLSGVLVEDVINSLSATTGAGGGYTVNGETLGEPFELWPSKVGYFFTPSSRSGFIPVGAQDFSATLIAATTAGSSGMTASASAVNTPVYGNASIAGSSGLSCVAAVKVYAGAAIAGASTLAASGVAANTQVYIHGPDGPFVLYGDSSLVASAVAVGADLYGVAHLSAASSLSAAASLRYSAVQASASIAGGSTLVATGASSDTTLHGTVSMAGASTLFALAETTGGSVYGTLLCEGASTLDALGQSGYEAVHAEALLEGTSGFESRALWGVRVPASATLARIEWEETGAAAIGTLLDDLDAFAAWVVGTTALPSDIEQQVMRLRRRVQLQVDWLRTTYGVDSQTLSAPLLSAADSVLTLARLAIEAKPPLVDLVLTSDRTAHEIAWQRYADLSRVREVVEINGLRNPLRIAGGQTLRVYAQ